MTPTLTSEQSLTIQLIAQRGDNAQLRGRIAALEFEQARSEIVRIVQLLQVAGYELDLQTLTYRPVPPAAPAEENSAA